MMKFLLLLVTLIILTASASTQVCSCKATTQKSRQHRSDAKHTSNYDDFVLKEDTITVHYIYNWQKKYTPITNTIKTTPSNPASKRKHNTPEDTMYTLKGYMWFVKQEDNDCDFHIEIGTNDLADTRIVVEVPKENKTLQKKIYQHLDSLGLDVMNCGTSSSKKAHFATPLPVTVTGLGFYDATHKPNTNHGDAHTKKYSWELHPVKGIIFE